MRLSSPPFKRQSALTRGCYFLLVTGANAGFGRAMLDCVLKNGDNVIAAVRRPETLADLPKDRVTVVKMDVTKPEQIDAAFEEIKSKGLRIDVLYNNAGFPNVGEVEAVPLDVCRGLFEVCAFTYDDFIADRGL